MFDKVTLEGAHVRLEPLTKSHLEGIREAIADGELWTLFVTSVPAIDQVDSFYGCCGKLC